MDFLIESKEYDYFERKKLIKSICRNYSLLKSCVIGKSCGGKEITALKIGSAESYSLIVAGVHGSERITATVLLMFINELCKALENGGYLAGINVSKGLSGRGIIFVPCLNPDGCDISLLGKKACFKYGEKIERISKGDFAHWNANLRGVDLNHNFDAGWAELKKREEQKGIFGPAPSRFGGFAPASEPETRCIAELCEKIHIRQVLALHSQGEVIYWNYGEKTPQRAKRMAQIMATSSGYALDVPIAIATGGGLKDWFIEAYGRPGFTVELGLGQNPLPAEMAEDIYNTVKEMLVLFALG